MKHFKNLDLVVSFGYSIFVFTEASISHLQVEELEVLMTWYPLANMAMSGNLESQSKRVNYLQIYPSIFRSETGTGLR